MNISKSILLTTLLLFAFAAGVSAQSVDPELLKKAKSMGLTEEQIRQEMAKKGATQTNSVSIKTTKESDKSLDKLKTTDFRKSLYEDKKNSEDYRLEREAYKLMELQELMRMRDSLGIGVFLQNYKKEAQLYNTKIFGNYLFKSQSISFSPNLNIPTPKDYVLSVGDQVVIKVWGDSELNISETISTEGLIYVTNLGPISLNGLTVAQAEAKIKQELSKIVETLGSTSHFAFSIGSIRSINVNVAGESSSPGTYTVPSLATVFHVLHLSGGASEIGSVRDIAVYRNSKKIADIDVYDFLINGDASKNIVLKDNDLIVINPYKTRVTVSGLAKRAMIFDLKANDALDKLINTYAGGVLSGAYAGGAKVYRNGEDFKEIASVKKSDFSKFLMIDGDSVVVEPGRNEFNNMVKIKGAVWRAGDYGLGEAISTLSKLIKEAGDVKGNEFASRGVIIRRNPDYTQTTLNFNTRDVLSGKSDITLHNYDEVYVPSIQDLREDLQISIEGYVNSPGFLPFTENMRIEDVIILAGGLKESASLAVLEVSRIIKGPNATTYTEKRSDVYSFKINADLTLSDQTKDFILEPSDFIIVRGSPHYKTQSAVRITGEVLFPGTYVLETDKVYLSGVIKLAKGTTPEAYLKGTSLERKASANDLRLKGVIDNMTKSMTGSDTMVVASSDIMTFPIAIDMIKAMKNPYGDDDLQLKPGDVINIPKVNNVVNILGGVYYAGATSYSGSKLRPYIIDDAAGYSKMARKRPFVIYANGKVKTTKSFIFKSYPKVEPGCMIVVPVKNWKNKMSFAETMGLVTGMTSMASSLSTLGIGIGSMVKK